MLLNCISLIWHVDVSFASLSIQALFVPSRCLLFLIMEWRKRGSLCGVDGGNPRKGIRLYRPGVLLQLLTSCPLSVLQLSLHAADGSRRDVVLNRAQSTVNKDTESAWWIFYVLKFSQSTWKYIFSFIFCAMICCWRRFVYFICVGKFTLVHHSVHGDEKWLGRKFEIQFPEVAHCPWFFKVKYAQLWENTFVQLIGMALDIFEMKVILESKKIQSQSPKAEVYSTQWQKPIH